MRFFQRGEEKMKASLPCQKNTVRSSGHAKKEDSASPSCFFGKVSNHRDLLRERKTYRRGEPPATSKGRQNLPLISVRREGKRWGGGGEEGTLHRIRIDLVVKKGSGDDIEHGPYKEERGPF